MFNNLYYKYYKLINFNSSQIKFGLNNWKLKIGNYGTVRNIDKYVVKSFKIDDDYFNEKEIYTTKLPQYCGCITKENENIFYNGFQIMITYENGMMIISDKTLIKNIIKISSKQIDKICIYDSYIFTEDKTNIGFLIKNNNSYNIYIDSFKIMKLLYFNDKHKLLYYENLGVNLIDSFRNRYPSHEQRIFMCIDLIRQVKELIELSIYHNDIKNDNIVLKSTNLNYYINLVDYGISITINDLLQFKYLTSPNSFSPEYYIINTLLRKLNIFTDMKDILDKSLHWIIGGIIINILSWKDIQIPIWNKYYNPNKYKIGYDISFEKHLRNYINQNIAFNYAKEMMSELFKNEYLYEDFFFSDSYDIINSINNYDSIKDIIDDRFKDDLIIFILIVHNLFEFSPDKKISLSEMYNKLKDYPGYQNYLNLKPTLI